LLQTDRLGAAILPIAIAPDEAPAYEPRVRESASALVYEEKLRLTREAAAALLDRNLERALTEPDANRKGVHLEVVTALMLSQVDGFEVISRGIANRSQQLDVVLQNKNTGGVLGGSGIVIAEAKNWTSPVGPQQYAWMHKKTSSKFGRAKLGFFITTDRFTRGVDDEQLIDSTGDVLIAKIHGELLPTIWNHHARSISAQIETVVVSALMNKPG
jgi:hypothetical protein